MTQDEMCKWLDVPAGTPVPGKIAATLGSLPAPLTARDSKAALDACLAWTAPRMGLPNASSASASKVWSGFSF